MYLGFGFDENWIILMWHYVFIFIYYHYFINQNSTLVGKDHSLLVLEQNYRFH